MSKVLNLKDNEMDDLADFLGRDIRVHRQYRRLPEELSDSDRSDSENQREMTGNGASPSNSTDLLNTVTVDVEQRRI
ncbi:hypothetical protein QQF64_023610 [Cirrhinus molitorella]|uniref:Uncharacterized protein n=1 Tax=Cirrhinus molitorella TaxID=172907 RepID=A0ABR3NJB9_9TELE